MAVEVIRKQHEKRTLNECESKKYSSHTRNVINFRIFKNYYLYNQSIKFRISEMQKRAFILM